MSKNTRGYLISGLSVAILISIATFILSSVQLGTTYNSVFNSQGNGNIYYSQIVLYSWKGLSIIFSLVNLIMSSIVLSKLVNWDNTIITENRSLFKSIVIFTTIFTLPIVNIVAVAPLLIGYYNIVDFSDYTNRENSISKIGSFITVLASINMIIASAFYSISFIDILESNNIKISISDSAVIWLIILFTLAIFALIISLIDINTTQYKKIKSIMTLIAGILLTIGFYATNPSTAYANQVSNEIDWGILNGNNTYSLTTLNLLIYSASTLGLAGVLFSINTIFNNEYEDDDGDEESAESKNNEESNVLSEKNNLVNKTNLNEGINFQQKPLDDNYENHKMHDKANHNNSLNKQNLYNQANHNNNLNQTNSYNQANHNNSLNKQNLYNQANHNNNLNRTNSYNQANHNNNLNRTNSYNQANHNNNLNQTNSYNQARFTNKLR